MHDSCAYGITDTAHELNPSFARSEELYNNNAGKIILLLLPLLLLPLPLGLIYEFISKGGIFFREL